jgi:hypothetical protein
VSHFGRSALCYRAQTLVVRRLLRDPAIACFDEICAQLGQSSSWKLQQRGHEAQVRREAGLVGALGSGLGQLFESAPGAGQHWAEAA